jgi:hypothetical protein
MNVTINENIQLKYKLKILEKEIKNRDDLISEIVIKLDNNKPNLDILTDEKNYYTNNRPKSAKLHTKNSKMDNNISSLTFDQKQSILIFNLKSEHRKLLNENEEKDKIIEELKYSLNNDKINKVEKDNNEIKAKFEHLKQMLYICNEGNTK